MPLIGHARQWAGQAQRISLRLFVRQVIASVGARFPVGVLFALVRNAKRPDNGSNSVAWRGRSVMKEVAGRQNQVVIVTAQGHRGWSRNTVAGNPRLL